jgi:hypothetical protein
MVAVLVSVVHQGEVKEASVRRQFELRELKNVSEYRDGIREKMCCASRE